MSGTVVAMLNYADRTDNKFIAFICIYMYNIHTTWTFEWDIRKELENIAKHRITFGTAIEIFSDPKVIHLEDEGHSSVENRFYAVGKTLKGEVVTVRYTTRGNVIRIFGAAKWRKWRKYYERENSGSK